MDFKGPTIIIAEAGVNHNGNIDTAKELVDVAAEAGADFVKFQTFSADKLVVPTAAKAKYQILTSDGNETQHEMLKRLELSKIQHLDLIQHCAKKNIKFFSTGFDKNSIEMLVDLGQKHFKIPSGEITNLPYLQHLGYFNYEIILSTGMSNLGEVEAAIDVLEKSGTDRRKITLLHCTTEYPTEMLDVNLMAMITMRQAFGLKVGYSDHTLGAAVPLAAVALGATVIEKHFTLDKSLPGPDHSASMEPEEFRDLIFQIRNLELALGSGIKKLTASEEKNLKLIRKSIVAKVDIKLGDVFTNLNIDTKRPGVGISPMQWNEVIGKLASRDFKHNELIEL